MPSNITRLVRHFEENGHLSLTNLKKISNVEFQNNSFSSFFTYIAFTFNNADFRGHLQFHFSMTTAYWLSDQMYSANDFKNLSEILRHYQRQSTLGRIAGSRRHPHST